MQRSIFAVGPTGADPQLFGLIRHILSRGAWVDYVPNWVTGHEALFEALVAGVRWQHHRRPMYDRVVDVPRLTGSSVRGGTAAPALVDEMAVILSHRYRRPLTSVSYAFYRDGRDSVAMHGDRLGGRAGNALVAIVSVGAPRRFLLREAGGPGAHTFDLGWGDLIVMGGTCQRTWRHGIPKTVRADPRISIQYREAAPEA